MVSNKAKWNQTVYTKKFRLRFHLANGNKINQIGRVHMCSIIGYCGTGYDMAEFERGFDATVSRGPDMSRVTDTGTGLLGFHRLSIMGLDERGMQPFEKDGSFAVCNG